MNDLQIAFHRALMGGEEAEAEDLLSQGAKIDLDGFPVSLHIASLIFDQTNKIAALRFLYRHGQDINATDGLECTALHHAAKLGEGEVFKALLAFKPDLTKQDKWGFTALHEAIDNRDIGTDVVDAWVGAGGFLDATNTYNQTALTLCCIKGRYEKAHALLSHGASIDIPDDKGLTAFYYALKAGIPDEHPALFGKMKVPEFNQLAFQMIAQMNDPDALVNVLMEQTPLHAIAWNKRLNDRNAPIHPYSHLELLIQGGASLYAADYYGDNIFHILAKRGDRDLYNFLFGLSVSENLDPARWNVPNRDGKFPAQLAEERGHSELARMLANASQPALSAE